MSEVPITQALLSHAARDPAKLAVRRIGSEGTVDETLSYGELLNRALQIAELVRERDGMGRPLMVPAFSTPAFVCGLLGAMFAGALPVPVPQSTRSRALVRLRAIADDGHIKNALDLGPCCDPLRTSLTELNWLSPSQRANEERAPPPPISPDSRAVLQYTSGSTAAPKGVVLSHGNISSNLAMLAHGFGADCESRILTWLPLHHDMGLIGQLLLAIWLGAELTLMTPLTFVRNPQLWIKAVAEQRATISGGPNFAYDAVVRRPLELTPGQDLRAWHVAFCGAEKVRPQTLRHFSDWAAPLGFSPSALLPCYGLAEATVYVSGGPPKRGMQTACGPGERNEVASCGRPAAEVVIVDGTDLRPISPGQEGEIWVAGPHIATAWKGSDAERFRAQFEDRPGVNFLRTGDLGFVRGGELFVTGRADDLIVHKGENIHPQDIEDSIRASDSRFGSLGAAFSLPSGEEEDIVAMFEVSRNLAESEHADMVRKARYAVAETHGVRLAALRLVAPGRIPRTTSGKIQRRAARVLYLASRAPCELEDL